MYGFSDGCPGCEASNKQKQLQLDAVRSQAKKTAIENKTLYILYEDSAGTYQYMEWKAAKTANIRHIEFVSFL